jgi:hypothetical protein
MKCDRCHTDVIGLEAWVVISCPYCGRVQWYNDGDEDDLSPVLADACRFFNASGYFYLILRECNNG